MKWAVFVCLATPIAILVGTGIAAIVPTVPDSLTNSWRTWLLGSTCMLTHLAVAIMVRPSQV